MIFTTLFSLCALGATSAEVTQASGRVELRPGQDSEFRALRVGDHADEGSRLRTFDKSSATLRFSDGSMLTLSERSSMLVTNVTVEERERSVIVVFFGKLWAKIQKQNGGRFEVASPTAVAGVRGTEFTTLVGDDGVARVDVVEGRVAVSDGPTETMVDPGGNAQSASSADKTGVSRATGNANDFRAERRENLLRNGEQVARQMRQRLADREQQIGAVVEQQKRLKQQLASAPESDAGKLREQLKKNAAELRLLRQRSEGPFGAFEHWGELIADPALRDKFSGRGYIAETLKGLPKIRRSFDALIAEGTDLSMKGMEKTLDQMRDGKPTLKDEDGSAKDLFDDK